MWSKRRPPDTQKQNFASFRNKITRRKRKLSQSRATTPTQNDFLVAGRLLITNGDLEPSNPNYNITISRSNSINSNVSTNGSFNSRRRQAVRLSNTSAENGRQSTTGTTPNYILEVAKDGDILSEKIVSVNEEEYRIRKISDEGVKPNNPDENTINRKDSFSTRRRQAMKKAPTSSTTNNTNLDDYQKYSNDNKTKHFMNRSMSIPSDTHYKSDMGIVLNLDHSFHGVGNFQNDDNMTVFSLPPRYSDSYIASKFNFKNNTANSLSTTKVAAHFLSSQNLSANSINNQFNNDNNKRYDVISVNQSHLASPTSKPSSNCATNVANSNSLLVSSNGNGNNMQFGVRDKIASNSNSTSETTTTTQIESKKQRSVKNKKKNAKKQTGDSSDSVNVKKTSTIEKSKPAKPVKENSSENSSYLKRVKSKIYKSRSDDSDKCQSNSVNKTQNENGTTSTATKTKTKKSKEKKTPEKSTSSTSSNKIPKITENSTEEDEFSEVQLRHSDFPFFYRQTSNLERIRPRTFGLRSSASNVGISDLVDSTSNILKLPLEKPKLVKSKSSSAINLNLLRSRRSKVQEQAKQSSKNADVEFKFMSFANISETSSVSVSRKFGPNNPITIEEVPRVKNSERPSSWTYNDIILKGDRPAGQPVSRSSSDKRPDAVTEEATRGTSDSHHEVEIDHDTHTHDNLHNVQRAKSSQPAINRSESYKEQSQKRRQIRERRKISDPNLSKSNDVDSDHQELSYHSGSSSNSSLSSSRSTESPQSTSLDTVPGAHGHHGHVGHQHTHSTVSSTSAHASSTSYDSDLEIEPDPPDWQSSVSEDVLARLHPEEKKRQEIINELFHTERSHVRNLKVLETVFYRPLLQNKCLPSDQVRLLFPNLEEMLEIHGTFNAAMKNRRKDEDVVGDIGELLLDMFDGQAGDVLKFAVAKFCARQHFALESLKEKRRKDPRLNSFLTDCESDKLCKRLQLKDIIPTGIQRLVKYPLLFDSLLKCTERVLDSTMMDSLPSSSPNTTSNIPQMGPTPLEVTRIRRALERSKEILNYVNQAVKEAEDKARLQEMQKKLDLTNFVRFEHPISSEFRNVDLTKHKLIHEGPLVWRLNKQNKLSVHVVLLEEVILLFHKQDDRYILKFYSSTSQIHSPIVKMSTVLVRHNATEKESLYLVNTSQNGAQIYDLNAQSTIECKTWFKHISDAAEAYKSRERRSELCTPEPDLTSASSSTDLTSTSITAATQSAVSQNGDVDKASSDGGDTHSTADTESTSGGGDSARNSGVIDEEQAPAGTTVPEKTDTDNNNTPGAEGGGTSTSDTGVGTGSSKREALMCLATDDQPLIQPSEVLVNVLPVHTAQRIVTLIEQVRRKDEAIRQALAEKEALVAEILQVPPEDYQTIVDMAGDISTTVDKEPTELVLAAINQASLLSTMVSESLNITETDTVLATSSGNPACSSQVVPTATTTTTTATSTLPTIPSHRVQPVASTLNTLLTALLKVVKEREDERERMRRELHKLREQIHAMHESQTGVTTQDGAACSSDTDIFYSAGDLANIEEDP